MEFPKHLCCLALLSFRPTLPGALFHDAGQTPDELVLEKAGARVTIVFLVEARVLPGGPRTGLKVFVYPMVSLTGCFRGHGDGEVIRKGCEW